MTAIDSMRQVGMSSGSSSAMTSAATEVVPATTKAVSAAVDAMPKKLFSPRNLVIAGVAVAGAVGDRGDGDGGEGGEGGEGGTAAATAGPTGSRCCRSRTRAPPTDEYFADGIADEVRGKLSRVNGARDHRVVEHVGVQGQSPSDRRRSRKELDADYLLVGKVRWAGGESGKRRVQVVPELIDVRTGGVKWQQSFDNDITDVFEVQSQIATRVAGALGVALAGGEKQELSQPAHRERRGVPAVPEGARAFREVTSPSLRQQIALPGAGGGTRLHFLSMPGRRSRSRIRA